MAQSSRSAVSRARKLADQIALPDPFDLKELCRNLGTQRDRRIVLAALPISAAGPCGLWLATDQVDFICFEEHTSALHQQHIVLHELGHILFAHSSPEPVHEVLGGLAPLLGRETLRMMLARQHSSYQPTDELEAEMFAYTILSRAGKRTRTGSDDQVEIGTLPKRLLEALEG